MGGKAFVVAMNVSVIGGCPYLFDGQYTDWIELYNENSGPVDLGGWFFDTDPSGSGGYPPLPSGTVIPAQGYLLVYAADVMSLSAGEIGTGFELDEVNGGYVGIYNTSGTVVSSVDYSSLSQQESSWSYFATTSKSSTSYEPTIPSSPRSFNLTLCGTLLCTNGAASSTTYLQTMWGIPGLRNWNLYFLWDDYQRRHRPFWARKKLIWSRGDILWWRYAFMGVNGVSSELELSEIFDRDWDIWTYSGHGGLVIGNERFFGDLILFGTTRAKQLVVDRGHKINFAKIDGCHTDSANWLPNLGAEAVIAWDANTYASHTLEHSEYFWQYMSEMYPRKTIEQADANATLRISAYNVALYRSAAFPDAVIRGNVDYEIRRPSDL